MSEIKKRLFEISGNLSIDFFPYKLLKFWGKIIDSREFWTRILVELQKVSYILKIKLQQYESV